MTLSNDLQHHVRPEEAKSHPLDVLCPSWIKDSPGSEREALLDQLSRLAELDDDIRTVELQCRLLERFDTVRAALIATSERSPIQSESLYQQLIVHYGGVATYAAQYSRLFADKLIDPNSVRRLLDLGAGYWNSTIVYEKLFPNLKHALGLEGEGAKVRAFEESRDRLLRPSREIFEMREADFFAEAQVLAAQMAAGRRVAPQPFDLVLMQSFYPMVPHSGSLYGYRAPDTKQPRQYVEMLSAVGNLLSSDGKLIVSVDRKDLDESATHLSWFCGKLNSLGAIHRHDRRLGIHPSWGISVHIEVSMYILSKTDLQRAARLEA